MDDPAFLVQAQSERRHPVPIRGACGRGCIPDLLPPPTIVMSAPLLVA